MTSKYSRLGHDAFSKGLAMHLMMFHRQVLANFAQQDMESFYMAWERFKDMLERFPNHQLPKWRLLQMFYYGLSYEARYWVGKATKIPHGVANPPLEVVLERQIALFEEMCEITDSRRFLDDQMERLKSTISRSHLEEDKQTMNPRSDHETKKPMVLFDDDCVEPREFEPLEYIEPWDEDLRALDVVLAQNLVKMDTHVIKTDLHLLSDVMSIPSHEFCDTQIASIVLDSQLEREEHFEQMLEEFLQEGEVKESLEDVEAHETIDLSSSMALLYTPPNDPFWPSSPTPPYYSFQVQVSELKKWDQFKRVSKH
ncbi:hypothetical protein L484_024935 [Morus notabilis]|uniref:Retrotransposon gag domain-containing protein n=1 Tax=Morus notabilis TaxID=981085 RepID=W9RRU1_9ROSA|nr:hypothetical protein L484_024935 [Morus notabilis]